MYKTRKVPFAFDYAGDADPYTGEIISGDVNVRNSGSNHGTHVSGTVAGFVQSQEGEVLFSGVAPDAQLMMMKVFADGGNSGATESAILNALEDAMTLGADAVNLSLGSDNGFAYDDTAIHGRPSDETRSAPAARTSPSHHFAARPASPNCAASASTPSPAPASRRR